MDRRKALKSLGLGAGAVIVAPSVMGLLQSCTNTSSWMPIFFSEAEKTVLEKLTEIIIPTSEDVPGANSLNIPFFLDRYYYEVMALEDQQFLRQGMQSFLSHIITKGQHNSLLNIKEPELIEALTATLTYTKEEEKDFGKVIGKYKSALKNNEPTAISERILQYSFATELRNRCIWAFKIHETIGEQHLAYDPIPGQQKGCVDLNEITGGKAWSL